jgi:hypothetical protein
MTNSRRASTLMVALTVIGLTACGGSRQAGNTAGAQPAGPGPGVNPSGEGQQARPTGGPGLPGDLDQGTGPTAIAGGGNLPKMGQGGAATAQSGQAEPGRIVTVEPPQPAPGA